MIVKLITIHVKSMEESLKFYKENLGFVEIRRIDHMEGLLIVFLKDEEAGMIELIEKSNQSTSESNINESVVSIAFSVEDIKHTIDELKNNGVEIDKGPIKVPSGETIAFIKDPNGVQIEFIQGFKM